MLGAEMNKSLLAFVVVMCVAGTTQGALTFTATNQQSGFSGILNPSLRITQTPWNFAGTNYSALTRIDTITLTLSVLDGDTAPNEFDEHRLTLGLDGIDTGLVLNGFKNGITTTLTLTGESTSTDVFQALVSDGQLMGTVIDADPAHNPNWIKLVGSQKATLSLTGPTSVCPTPGALFLCSLGTAMVGWVRRNRIV